MLIDIANKNLKLKECAIAIICVALNIACTPHSQETSTQASQDSDVSELSFTVSEGTWMSVDVSPDGEEIVFDLLGDIYLLPVDGGSAKAIVSGGSSWDTEPRFSPDGSKIAFISDRVDANNIWTFDISTGATVQVTTEVREGLSGPEWSHDGKYLYARQKLNVESINYKGPWVLQRYDVETGSRRAVLGLDEYDHPEKGKVQVLGLTPTGPNVSSDGSYLYFAGQTGDLKQGGRRYISFQITRMNLETGSMEEITEGYDGAFRPAVSPDGRQLAFARREEGETHLYIRDLETDDERMVLSNITRDDSANRLMNDLIPGYAWTPDGQSIVLTKDGKIISIDAATGRVQNIPFSVDVALPLAPQIAPATRIRERDDLSPKVIRWLSSSPDGQKIAFQAVGKIWLFHREKGVVEKAFPGAFSASAFDTDDALEFTPSWSPDGQKIAFAEWSAVHGGAIRVFDFQTGEFTQITDKKGKYANPSWSPDGEKIMFVQNKNPFPAAGTLSPIPGRASGAFGVQLVELSTRETKEIFLERRSKVFTRPRFNSAGTAITLVVDAGYDNARFISVDIESGEQTTLVERKWSVDGSVSPSGDLSAIESHQSIFVFKSGLENNVGDESCGEIASFSGDSPIWLDDETLGWVYDRKFITASVERIEAQPCPVIEIQKQEPLDLHVPKRLVHGTIALVNARLIALSDEVGSVIENGALIITDGRISAMGTMDEMSIPDDVEMIDLEGATIMPGMIDMHGHPFQSYTSEINPKQNRPFLFNLAYGVTAIRDPSGPADVAFSTAELVESGQIIGPRYFGTGEPIAGYEVAYSERIDSLDKARAVVAKRKAKGAIHLKEYGIPTRKQRRWLAQAAREANMGIVNENTGDYHLVMAAATDGYTGVEHSLTQAPLYEDALQLLSASKMAYDPVLVFPRGGAGGRTYYLRQLDLLTDEKYMRFSDIGVAYFADRMAKRSQIPDHDYVFFKQGAAANDLKKAGGLVVSGSHAEGIALHFDVWSYVESGMTALDAIETVTLSAARATGIDADLGSLEPGKLADFIILENNPLDDIRHTLSIKQVVKGGVIYDGDTLNEVWPTAQQHNDFFWIRYNAAKKGLIR